MLFFYLVTLSSDIRVHRPDVDLFVHEVGHCLGAHHNREVFKGSDKPDKYSYGYCLPNTKYATIMTYPSTCEGGQHEEWIRYFSNPDVSYEV